MNLDKHDTSKITVSPSQSKVFIDKIGSGGSNPTKNLKYCPCQSIIKITPTNPIFKMTKDPNNTSNWTKEAIKGHFTKSPAYTRCYFEVNQTDIQ